MTDITEYVERYRLALRHIWNSCFYADPHLRHWEALDSFRTLKAPLFRSVVADSLGLEARSEVFGKGFVVVPGTGESSELPQLVVNQRIPSRPDEGVWEVVNGPVKVGEINLTLVDLFDWSPMRYIDLRYYVVLIDGFPARPEKVGQHALVDVTHARVFWTRGGAEETEIPKP